MLWTVYVDQEMRGTWIGAKAYLHVTNLETREQCGDIAIPGAIFPVRRFVVAANRLVSVQLLAAGQSTEARRMRVIGFGVNLERCEWVRG